MQQFRQEMQQQIKDLKGQVADLNTKVENTISDDQKAEYDENVENMNEVETDVTNQEKTSQDEEDDVTAEDPDAETMEIGDLFS